MDMESSFLPDHHMLDYQQTPSLSKPQPDVSSPSRRANAKPESATDSSFVQSTSSNPQRLFEDPAQQFEAPAPRHTYRISEERTEDLELEDTTHPDIKHSLSSPSAAAAQRSRLRASAGFSTDRNATTLALTQSRESSELEPHSDRDIIERPSSAPQETSRLTEATSDHATDVQEQANEESTSTVLEGRDSLPGEPQRPPNEQVKPSVSKRPSHLNNRQASQRSSASSFLSNEGGSDLTFTASGGVTPGSLSTVRPDNELSRLPSLGSVASTMSISTERSTTHRRKRLGGAAPTSAPDPNLTPVAEHRAKTSSPPETPQAAESRLSEPRDTVIARNVRDVEVPATVARNYREAQSYGSTAKSFGTPNFSRTKGELTLKEQNSRIDKLSKENFDLKLKIHYLYQALQDRSEEGVKELISKNAQLSTDVIKIRKENQALRKRLRQLERESKARDDGLSAVRTVSESEDVASSRSWQQAQMEDEIAYLRDRIQSMEGDNERLRRGDVAREFEKRRMADKVKSMAGGDQGELLRDELEQEKSKRARSDHEAFQLRQEVNRLKAERGSAQAMHLRPDGQQPDHQGRPASKSSANSQDGTSLSGTTIPVEQLKYDNTELRKTLAAQISMLTSKNRERERLQQELEDLKLAHRRGEGLQSGPVSVSGDSILDRSVSRNNLRPPSRASTQRTDPLSENEKDRYEAKQAALRDENAGLRMRIQDLQSELDMLTGNAEHLENLRRERDDALIIIEEERDYAADAIDQLEARMEQKDKDINQLLADLRAKEDEAQSLEQEVQDMNASMSRVVDASEGSHTIIQNLERELAEATGDCEATQQSLQDALATKERLEVQAESSQSEIAFLREEQESDKIKISDLQSALTRAKSSLRDEKERLSEFEEMDAEVRKAREETRRIKKSLTSKEEEAAAHRDTLDDVGDTLRRVVGIDEQSIPSLLKSVGRLRRDLESSRAELEQSNGGLEEKHRKLQDHIMLLESSEAERQRLGTMLEKEKQGRRQEQLERERLRKIRARNADSAGPEQTSAEYEERILELQRTYGEALRERNQVLYNLWTRLSGLCGPEWVEDFHAATNHKLPSFENMSDEPSSVDAPVSLALDTISQTLSTFRTRIRSTEQDLYRDLETLSDDLENRSRRIEELEHTLAERDSSAPMTNGDGAAELARIKDENRLLRRELKILKQGAFALPGLPSPQLELDNAAQEAALVEHERQRMNMPKKVPSPTGYGQRRRPESAAGSERSALQRHHTAPVAEPTESEPSTNGDRSHALAPSEQRWVLRLKELEKNLRAEREARLLDRHGAMKRLEEREREARDLKRRLEMEKQRAAFHQSQQNLTPASETAVEQQ